MFKKKIIFLFVSIFILFSLSSCWNYREVNQMAIVIGAAIDRGETDNYMLTIEVMDVGGGQQTEVSSEILSIEGETVFDAVRKFISITGKRGYWGHIQVVIISEELAREDISDVVNFFRQDAETRGDLHVVISKECKAKDIIRADKTIENVVSETLGRSLENSKHLSEIPETRLYTLTKDLESDKICATVPAISLSTVEDKTIPILSGTAVFRKGKLAGYLDGKETKAMLFLKNEIEGGVIVTRTDNSRISLEILENNTKIKTKAEGDLLTLDITVETSAAINEVNDDVEFESPTVLEDIENQSAMQLKDQLQKVIDKAKNLSTDIFGFAQKIYENNPKKYEEISDNYEKEFTNINVNLSVKIEIMNTSIIFKSLRKG